MNESIENNGLPILPASSRELVRVGKQRYNVNDDVTRLGLSLYDDKVHGDNFRDLMAGNTNRQSVTGKLDWDDFEATKLLKVYATEKDSNSFIAVADNVTVFKAFRVFKRRYPQLSRRHRLQALHSSNGKDSA